MSYKKPTVYLASGMENSKNLGAGWREELTPALERLGFEVLNPVLFEPEQLKGLHTNRLPEEMPLREGGIMKPTHWHQLKNAPYTSSYYKRFKHYMQRIIRYDLKVVAHETDVVVCYWTRGTAKGAGTHSELTEAFKNNIPVYVVLEEGVDFPGWAHGCSKKIVDNFDELIKLLEIEA